MSCRAFSACFQRFSELFATLSDRFDGGTSMGPRGVFATVMMLTTPGLDGRNYTSALQTVYDQWGAELSWKSCPRSGTLSKKRRQVGPDVFRRAWEQTRAQVVDQLPRPQGRPMIALDGTWFLLPDTLGVKRRWEQTQRTLQCQPQALMVSAVDVSTRVPCAAEVQSVRQGEVRTAGNLLADLPERSIILGDRYLSGLGLIRRGCKLGHDWIVRLRVGDRTWRPCQDFRATGALEATTTIPNPDGEPIPVRLIRCSGRSKDGDPIILMTTLMDDQSYPRERIRAWYRRRWEVESFYKDIKIAMNLEAFHAKDPDLILQEVSAILIWMTLLGHAQQEAHRRLASYRPDYDPEAPDRWMINRRDLLCLVTHTYRDLLRPIDRRWWRTWYRFNKAIDDLVRRSTRRRPDRSFPRRRKSPNGRRLNKK